MTNLKLARQYQVGHNGVLKTFYSYCAACVIDFAVTFTDFFSHFRHEHLILTYYGKCLSIYGKKLDNINKVEIGLIVLNFFI